MRQTKQARIVDLERTVKELRELRAGDMSLVNVTRNELDHIKAENESLRTDKTWLKSMLSNTIQTFPEIFRNRNAISR